MLRILLLSLLLVFSACSAGTGTDELAETTEPLAPYMSLLQRYTAKLGYAIREKNQPLALYYVDALESSVGTINARYGQYKSYDIGKLVPSHMNGPIDSLRNVLGKSELDEGVEDAYRALVNRCNACHKFTGFGEIVIKPVGRKASPFSQQFSTP